MSWSHCTYISLKPFDLWSLLLLTFRSYGDPGCVFSEVAVYGYLEKKFWEEILQIELKSVACGKARVVEM